MKNLLIIIKNLPSITCISVTVIVICNSLFILWFLSSVLKYSPKELVNSKLPEWMFTMFEPQLLVNNTFTVLDLFMY